MQLLGTEQAVLDRLQAAVIITDLDGVITRWNHHAELLYGWTAEEALGRNVLELLVPTASRDQAESIMRDLVTERSWLGEFPVRRRDGTPLFVHVTNSLLTDEAGRPAAVIGISFDVTERRQAEERLAVQYGVTQALAEAKTLAEAAPRILQSLCENTGWQVGAIWMFNARAGVLRPVEIWQCSGGGLERFVEDSRTREFAPGIGLPGRVHESGDALWVPDIGENTSFPRSDAAREAGLHTALAFPIRLGPDVFGVLEFFGTEIRQPDQELLQMLEGIGGQVGQFIERREAERMLRRTDARRRAILEASLDCIVAMDHRGRVTEFNRAAERTFGYAREEVIGRELADVLIPPALRDAHRDGLARYLEGRGGSMLGQRVELSAQRKDGSEFPVEIAITRVDLPGPALFKGAIRDITERKRAEAALAGALDEEQRARAQVDAAQRRLAFLAEAGTLLASARDFASALEALGRLAVTLLADICLIDIVDDGGELQRMVAVHADPGMNSLTKQLQGQYPPKRGGPHPAARVVETGQSEFSPEMSEEFLRATTRNEEHFRIAKQLGMTSYICVPLIARERTLGTITLVSTDPARRFGPGDVTLTEDLARRTALSIDNVRLLESEQRARRRAERAAERTAALQVVTIAMSEALSSEGVARVVLEQAVAQMSADTGAVGLVTPDGTQIETIHSIGYPPELLDLHRLTPLKDSYPMTDAVRTGAAVFAQTRRELLDRFGDWTQGARSQAFIAVPITFEERSVGALFLGFAGPRTIRDADIQLLQALGRQAAHALERARLYEAERRARAEAERARQQLSLLAEASSVLAAGLMDYEQTLATVAELAVTHFADWCIVDLISERGTIERVALAHVDPAKQELARELQRRHPPDPDAPTGVPNVLRTARPELVSDITDEMLVRAARDEESLRVLRALGRRSSMIVPLVARGRTLGAITFISAESGRRYTVEDLVLAEDLARRAALAVDNARLYQDRSSAARTLQRSLLPPQLPVIPGMELAALYRPSGEGNEIGGDFYDLFETGDGSWGLVIGDVCGKGVEAAARTGLVRHTVRAVAMREQRPSAILTALNQALSRESQNDRFCTVLFVRVVTNDEGARLTVCSGGHPLPMILRADGAVEQAGQPGTLLGVFPDAALADSAVDLRRGDTLVLYTDGVTEERDGKVMFGESRLRATLENAAGLDAQALATALGDAVQRFRSAPPRDDMAILALQVQP